MSGLLSRSYWSKYLLYLYLYLILDTSIKGAAKLYFMHFSCVVIIFFNTDSYKSAFPVLLKIYSLIFQCYVFFCPFCFELLGIVKDNICLTNVYVTKSFVILFSLLYELLVKTRKIVLEKTCFQRGFECFKSI